MRWLRGKSEIVELTAGGTANGSEAVILQRTEGLDRPVWVTLDCGHPDTEWLELRHSTEAERSPYAALVFFGDLPVDSGFVADLRRRAVTFVETWGLPYLPSFLGNETDVSPPPIYCFPLGEFNRIITLVAALGGILRTRFERARAGLDETIAGIARVPTERLIPLGGEWRGPKPVRGCRAIAYWLETSSDRLLPDFDWDPGMWTPLGPSYIPGALEIDSYAFLRWLNQHQESLPDRRLNTLRDAADSVAAGIAVEVRRLPESLWRFVLDEWGEQYGRKGANPYCRYQEADGTVCGALLPPNARANRHLCDYHRKISRWDGQREWARIDRAPGKDS